MNAPNCGQAELECSLGLHRYGRNGGPWLGFIKTHFTGQMLRWAYSYHSNESPLFRLIHEFLCTLGIQEVR